MKVSSVRVPEKKVPDGSDIRYYFKKVIRYFDGTFCTADTVASAIFADIMSPLKVISGQKRCKLTLAILLDIFRPKKEQKGLTLVLNFN